MGSRGVSAEKLRHGRITAEPEIDRTGEEMVKSEQIRLR